jgi:hypothetical protein
MLVIDGIEVLGNSGAGDYASLKPWQDEYGVNWYIVDAAGYIAIEDYTLRRRTQAEMDALRDPPLLPVFWVSVTITPMEQYFQGASGLYAFPNTADGAFQVAASVWADETQTVPILDLSGASWVYILRKINKSDGVVLDTVRLLKSFGQDDTPGNVCAFTLSPASLSSGRYSLDEGDFDNLRIDADTVFQFKLVAPNSPEGRRAFEFDIYDANL